MTLDYATIRDVDLTALSEAVTKWRNLPGNFDTVATSFRTDVTKGLRDSDWHGESADAAFAKFDIVEKQFQAASDEAKDVYLLLHDAHEKFSSAQKRLHSIAKEITEYTAQDKNGKSHQLLKMGVDGTVYVDPPEDFDGDAAALQKGYLETTRAYNQRVKSAIMDASDADDTLHWALTQDHNGRKPGFDSGTFHSIKDAEKGREQAKEDADKALHLADLGGDNLSVKQLAHLNGLLAKHEGDPYFTEKFATGLGSKGTLKFWADVYNAHQGNIPKEDAEKLRKLQTTLGLTLASATHSNSDAMKAWKDDVIAEGRHQFITDPTKTSVGPYGYQIMSSLLRHGKYDSTFLNRYGDSLVDFERHTSAPNLWASGGQLYEDLNFDLRKNDDGKDPMAGFLEALGHNHDASTQFFKSEDHFDYLTGSGDNPRIWPQDNAEYVPNPDQKQKLPGFDSLGKALEAAATGHDAGTPPTAAQAVHSRDEAKIMHQIVTKMSENTDLVRPGMADSLGRISAEYMPDIHRAIDPDTGGNETLFPIKGAEAKLSERDVTRFLHTVGQDPDGYAAVNLGQHNYTANLIEYQASHPDAYINGLSDDRQEATQRMIQSVSRDAGEIEGIIGAGRDYALEHKIVESDDSYNTALGKAGTWGGSLVGVGIGLGTSQFTGPGGAFAGAILGTASAEIINGIVAPQDSEALEKAVYRNGADYETLKNDTVTTTRYAIGATQGLDHRDVGLFQSAAADSVESGFGDARDGVKKYFQGETSRLPKD